MNCKDIQKLLQLYHDGELDEEQRRTVESHLAECPHCQAKLAELTALDELIVDGEAEQVPDPGRHYWHSFSMRVTRRLTSRREAIIPRRRTRPLKFRIIPYLSAAVAIFLALVISIPLLKQAPTKFTEEEIAELTAAPQKSEVGFKRLEKEPPEAELRDKKLELGEYAHQIPEGEIIKTEEGLTAPPVEAPAADVTAEKLEAAEPSTRGRERAARDEVAKPSMAKAAQVPSAEAETEEEALVGGAAAKEAEGAWSFDRRFATEGEQTGILRVEIDSTGQLAKVTIYRSSGDPKSDTMALKVYRQQWEGKIFRERQRALLVPFSQESNN